MAKSKIPLAQQVLWDTDNLVLQPSGGKVRFGGGMHVTKTVTAGTYSLDYAASITPFTRRGNVCNVGTLTGDVTINAPAGSDAFDGQLLVLRFQQDDIGGRQVTWSAAYSFGTDVTPAMMPTTAGTAWEVACRYFLATDKWRVLGIARGFSD